MTTIKKWLKKHFPGLSRVLQKIQGFPGAMVKKMKLRSFTKKMPYAFSFNDNNFTIVLDPQNGDVDDEIYCNGAYEKEILNLYSHEIQSGQTYVDIGANIGQHALYASRLVGEHGRVFAFEPISRIRQQLSESVALSEMHNFTLLPYACGAETMEATIHFRKGNIGGSSLVPATGQYQGSEKISVVRADDILRPLGHIDFIKIDAEGYEYEVLLGLKDTLAQYHPKMLLEYSPTFYNKRAGDDQRNGFKILELLQTIGYTLTDLIDGKTTKDLTEWGRTLEYDQANILLIHP